MNRLTLAAVLVTLGAAAPADAQTAAPATLAPAALASAVSEVEKVRFRSMDEPRTELVGYLFRPSGQDPAEGAPALVLLHGRGGIYSSLADGVHDASTLTRRLKFWGGYWAERGYYALVVDSFGPRGHADGFAAGTYASRPPEVNEVTVRPLDAYAALRFLRGLNGVADDRIGVMGFSNGASTVLATMANDKPGDMRRLGFRAGVALYPGCGLQGRFRQGYAVYAPVAVFMGDADREVSPERCQALVDGARSQGQSVELILYPDAAHGFDDPSRSRQRVRANAEATQDLTRRLGDLMDTRLAPR